MQFYYGFTLTTSYLLQLNIETLRLEIIFGCIFTSVTYLVQLIYYGELRKHYVENKFLMQIHNGYIFTTPNFTTVYSILARFANHVSLHIYNGSRPVVNM